jgi:UDP-N-acetylmuramate--alanine ligase
MKKSYHLVGIGGIGMSGIAQLLLKRGCLVSGSDVKENQSVESLRLCGARVFIGHSAANIEDPEVVIYSSAVGPDNPELQEALRRGIPVIKRAQALAELMRDRTVVTVAGSHGKTTTTALVSYLLLEAGLSPTMAIGGTSKNIGNNAWFGAGQYFVAEADESDGSFLSYSPRYSIVTNIDREHLDYYGDFDGEMQAFRDFFGLTHPDGVVFYCKDDKNLRDAVGVYHGRKVSFGMSRDADIYADSVVFNGLASSFDCYRQGKFVRRFELSLGGMHNVSNSLGVIALGLELGISVDVIARVLAGFQGTARRLDVKYRNGEYTVMDDYGHHPTEIMVSLSAVKQLRGKRVIAVFQPHRYTRTQLLLKEFGRCFDDADHIVLTDIYAASEAPIPGITGMSVFEEVKANDPNKQVEFLPKDAIADYLFSMISPGDVVVVFGAGDIVKVSDELAARLSDRTTSG